MIPAVNDMELEKLLEQGAAAGATPSPTARRGVGAGKSHSKKEAGVSR
jgi:hypothetical protein